MSDIDRYLTDEMIEQGKEGIAARLGWASIHWGAECLHADAIPHIARAALEAVLPGIIQQAKAEALREAADQLDAYSPRDNPTPADPRWTCDLGYYGEAAWLRDQADRIEQGGQP